MERDYVYVVRSAPAAGQESAYNDWYTNVHLPDVLAVPGFVAAQRFRISEAADENESVQPYLALYFMRTADPAGLLATLSELVESGQMAMSEAFDRESVQTYLYEAVTGMVPAPPAGPRG